MDSTAPEASILERSAKRDGIQLILMSGSFKVLLMNHQFYSRARSQLLVARVASFC